MKLVSLVGFAVTALGLAAESLEAAPTTFVNAGLKERTVVVLDVSGKTASGTFNSQPYDDDDGSKISFTGKVIATPKGKTGVYLEIKFAGSPPYTPPPGAKTLVWRLIIVKHRAHLFIPMQERLYGSEDNTPRWAVSYVEFEPTDK